MNYEKHVCFILNLLKVRVIRDLYTYTPIKYVNPMQINYYNVYLRVLFNSILCNVFY